jgi:hypothetical protein
MGEVCATARVFPPLLALSCRFVAVRGSEFLVAFLLLLCACFQVSQCVGLFVIDCLVCGGRARTHARACVQACVCACVL